MLPDARNLSMNMHLRDALALAKQLGFTVTEHSKGKRMTFVYGERHATTPLKNTEEKARVSPEVVVLLRAALRMRKAEKELLAPVSEPGPWDVNGPLPLAPGVAAPTWEDIDPEQAAAILKLSNAMNPRKIVLEHAMRIAEQIERDQWVPNGEAIIFDSTGSLIDGQHRLSACVLANKPIRSLVVRGVAPEARETIDVIQRARTVHDIVRGRGQDVSRDCVALVRLWLGWKAGRNTNNLFVGNSHARINPQEVASDASLYADVANDLGRVLRGTSIVSFCPATLILFAPFVRTLEVGEIGRSIDVALEYLSGFRDLTALSDGDPRLALARYLSNAVRTDRGTRGRACVDTWNAWMDRRTLGKISTRDSVFEIVMERKDVKP